MMGKYFWRLVCRLFDHDTFRVGEFKVCRRCDLSYRMLA